MVHTALSKSLKQKKNWSNEKETIDKKVANQCYSIINREKFIFFLQYQLKYASSWKWISNGTDTAKSVQLVYGWTQQKKIQSGVSIFQLQKALNEKRMWLYTSLEKQNSTKSNRKSTNPKIYDERKQQRQVYNLPAIHINTV